MSDPNPSNAAIPTAAQLFASRQKQWHQQGEALLTIENLRSWINAAGLVLFLPRPQIVAPAPSLVEAVLGAPNASPTPAETEQARDLLARLVAEGHAVPLNLLGASHGAGFSAAGDTPDFVASTAVFSYVFTLRGDKGWKQPPATAGAMKVSPLALATHEALAKRGPLSVYDLTTELAKEVTEAAVMRALSELWAHLRVLPLAQPDGQPALWELASARFIKQIKAGANAGQPSALSALISLYLGQAVAASEDEIESFLSPLAARSRIRDVIHALVPARQLETIAVEGRTMLHISGDLPAFAEPLAAGAPGDTETDGAAATEVAAESGEPGDESASRITKYVPKPKKIGTGYLAKASPAKFGARVAGARSEAGKPGGFKPRPGSGPAPDRQRRPFAKPAVDYAARGFDKPWEEEKARRLASASKPSQVSDESGTDLAAAAGEAGTVRAPRVYSPRENAGFERGTRPSFGSKPSFGRKPSFGGKPSFGSRPSPSSKSGEDRPPRREFAPRSEGDAQRKTFSKPGTFGRKREGFGGKPASGEGRLPRREFGPRTGGGTDRPERGERPAFAGSKSFSSARPKTFGSPRTPGSFAPRTQGSRPARAEGESVPRKPYPPRGAGFFSGKPRPSDDRQDRADRPAGGSRDRPDRGVPTESGKRIYPKFDARKPDARRPDGPRARTDRPSRPFSSDRPASARPASARPDRPARPQGGGFTGKSTGDFAPRRSSGKPGGGSAGKKPFGKAGGAFAGKPGSTFAKFADNAKPFGNRPPARKYKPKESKGDESL